MSISEENPTDSSSPPPRDGFRLGLVQGRAAERPEENRERAEAGIREAAARGAQVIALQELFEHRYFCQEHREERFELAAPVPGPVTERFAALAAELEVALILPVFERRAPGVFHNTAAVIDADGSLLGKYRKLHVPEDPGFHEKFYFTPGDSPLRSFSTRHGKVGVLICWDQWFPEAARAVALDGAELIVYPTAIGWLPAEKATRGEEQRAAWRAVQVGHAIANQVFVAAVNRVGHEPGRDEGIEFWGGSFVVDPAGNVIAEAGEEEAVLVVDCPRSVLESRRREWPFYRDRRIDAYGALLAHPQGERA